MDQKDYQRAFNSLSFSEDFQAKTKQLLQERARELGREKKNMKNKRKMLIAAVLAAGMMVVSVSAATFKLSLADIVGRVGNPDAMEIFNSEGAVEINETKTFGEYTVTLEGIASGKALDNMLLDTRVDRTYAVFSITHTDGSPIDSFLDFSYSPLVGGYNVACVNAWTLHGGYSMRLVDGCAYYVVETDCFEMFADHPVYFAIYEGGAPSVDLFRMEGDSISLREGVNGVIFTLDLDESNADPAAAEAFVKSVGMRSEPITDEEYEELKKELEPLRQRINGESAVFVPGEATESEEY